MGRVGVQCGGVTTGPLAARGARRRGHRGHGRAGRAPGRGTRAGEASDEEHADEEAPGKKLHVHTNPS